MAERRLPVRPDLEQLRHQAKDLLRAVQAGDPDALAEFRAHHPVPPDPSAAKLADAAAKVLDQPARTRLAALLPAFQGVADWNAAALEAVVRNGAEAGGVKLGALAQPLRAALTGAATSPPIFEVMEVLGREESLARLIDIMTMN